VYLIIQDRKTGGVLNAKRLNGRPDWPAVRQTIERLFPKSVLYSPLEAAPHNARIIIVYGSRTKDGKSRCTSFDMWAIQEAKPFELTAEQETW